MSMTTTRKMSLPLLALLSACAVCCRASTCGVPHLRLRGGSGINAPSSSACIKIYSDNAQGYDMWFEEAYFSGILAAEFTSVENAIGSYFAGRESLKVLEVGMGTGRFSLHLKQRHPKYEITGVEPAEGMRRRCLENFKLHNESVKVLECTAEDLDVCKQIGDKMDCVLFVTVFGFLQDHEKALRNIRAMLSPEGCVVVAFIDRATSWGKEYAEMTREDIFYSEGTCVVHLSEVVEIFRKNKFELVQDSCYQTLINHNATTFDLDEVDDDVEALKVERGCGTGMWSVLCFRLQS